MGQSICHRALGIHGTIGIGIRWNIRHCIVARPFPAQLKPAWEAHRIFSHFPLSRATRCRIPQRAARRCPVPTADERSSAAARARSGACGVSARAQPPRISGGEGATARTAALLASSRGNAAAGVIRDERSSAAARAGADPRAASARARSRLASSHLRGSVRPGPLDVARLRQAAMPVRPRLRGVSSRAWAAPTALAMPLTMSAASGAVPDRSRPRHLQRPPGARTPTSPPSRNRANVSRDPDFSWHAPNSRRDRLVEPVTMVPAAVLRKIWVARVSCL